jgi:hypothetical protein
MRSLGVPKSGASGQKGMISYSFKASCTAFIFFVLPSYLQYSPSMQAETIAFFFHISFLLLFKPK